MNFFKKNSYLLLILFSGLFASSESFAASPEIGFSEKMQFQFIERLFHDELHETVQKEATIYLKTFPEGQSRETVYFLRTRSNELRLSNIQEVVKDYHQYRLNYPKGQWLEDAMFSEGYLRVRLGQYEQSIAILEAFLDKFSKSDHRENALYWLGNAAFYSAASARQNQSLSLLKPLYRKAITALSDILKPEQLTEEQQIDRLYFLGWLYQFQQQPHEAQKWLLEYAKQAKDKSNLAKVYYQLGQNEKEAKNYAKAITFFEKLDQFPDSPFFNRAVFWKAEMSYWISVDKPLAQKNNSHYIKIIALYESYLKKKDSQYQAITYYRLGELYANIKGTKKAITHYQKYLETEEATNVAEVHYELGKLFSGEKNDTKAIEEFQLARQSKTYQNDGTLIQLLVQLLEKTDRQAELQALLAEAKNNKTLKGPERNYFLLQAVDNALQRNNCDPVLKDLKQIPASLKKANRHYLLYARGNCFIQKKQWENAETDLIPLIEDPEYEKLAFDLLITTYQGSKNWGKLTQHIEAFWQKESFILSSQHFEILIAAYHQLQDWQKISTTYIRWESVHQPDTEKLELLINWAQVEEKLEHLEKSKALYERALTLGTPIDLTLRESIVARLADSYLKDGDYQNYSRIYEQYLMPHLTDATIRQKYALALGSIYYDPLQEYNKARKWLQEVDQGQVTDLEIEAIQKLSAIEEAEGNITQAIQILDDLTQRPLEKTQWHLSINDQLGSLHEGQKQWGKALEKYRIVAAHSTVTNESEKAIQKNAQKRIQEIEKSLDREKLDRFIEEKAWQQVGQLIQDGLKKKNFLPSHELYEILVYAEFQRENWKGVLSAYEKWGKFDPSKTKSFNALLAQGEASEKLSNDKLVKKFYGDALKLVPVKDLQNRIFLTERLGEIYEKEKNYKKVVELYEKAYPFLKDHKNQIAFSYKIGGYYQTQLKQRSPARRWFAKTDKGGTSDEELSAILNLVETETKPEISIKMLARLASRPISKKNDWYIVINYKLGDFYEKQADYSKAIIAYNRVSKAKPSKQYGEFQQAARKQAKALIDYQKKLKAD